MLKDLSYIVGIVLWCYLASECFCMVRNLKLTEQDITELILESDSEKHLSEDEGISLQFSDNTYN
jgi:hypothetical protein